MRVVLLLAFRLQRWANIKPTLDEYVVFAVIFICMLCRWLDEGEDDGKLERDLALTRILGDEAPEKGDWCLYVVTSEDDNSGTDAQVTVTLFGEKGNSGPLELGKPGVDLFEAGASDQFEVSR